jgi:hypothetical protein
MPVPEKYRRQLIESHAAAEREARRDTRRAWVRVLAEIVVWTVLGLTGIALAWRSGDFQLGWIYWWGGATVWVGGVSVAVLSAYKRGEKRGDW